MERRHGATTLGNEALDSMHEPLVTAATLYNINATIIPAFNDGSMCSLSLSLSLSLS